MRTSRTRPRSNSSAPCELSSYANAHCRPTSRARITRDERHHRRRHQVEFGVDKHGNLRLADEVFTPDSSRYWRADDYQEGVVQQSFDKQFVRNWLTGPDSGWDRNGESRRHHCRPTSSRRLGRSR